MTYHILTIFPEIFTSFLKESILARAQEEGKVKINIHDIRDYTTDKHRSVDDTPYGGGPGMVMKIEPIYEAITELGLDKLPNSQTILMSARGKQFDQPKAQSFSKLENLVIIAGRYEGVDQRVADNLCDEEISIGPYVLNGGEVPAMAIIEATFRLLPGVLGNVESAKTESFSEGNKLEAPQYTKPDNFNNWSVPEVLLSGDHQKINDWRQKQSRS
ncbi:tRNA (guanosine(37)-N1)-methyltransferase TrmD [Patescibacteria group bacterium]